MWENSCFLRLLAWFLNNMSARTIFICFLSKLSHCTDELSCCLNYKCCLSVVCTCFLVALLFCYRCSGYRYKLIEHSSSSSSINTCARSPDALSLSSVFFYNALQNWLKVSSLKCKKRGLSTLCGSEYISTDRRGAQLLRNTSSECLLSYKVINTVSSHNPPVKSTQKTS